MYHESMVDVLFERGTGEDSGRRGLVDTEGKSLTYSELVSKAISIARFLVEKLGVEAGDKVAFAPINKVEGVALLYACWLAGASVAVIDPLSHSEDLLLQLEISKPKILFTHDMSAEKHCKVAEEAGARCVIVEHVYGEAISGGWWEGYWRPRAWEPAIVYFYAGIAGRTMEVIHTHSTITASATITAIHFKFGEGDRVLVTPPVSHALGLQIATLASHVAAALPILYAKKGKLDPGKLVQDVGVLQPTIIFGAPQLYQALLSAGLTKLDSLRFAVSAGAPLPTEVREKWEKQVGAPLLQLYGMTEAAPVSATLPEDNPLGSIGVPMPGVEVALASPEDPGKRVNGGVGELLVRGPMVMRGYSDFEETRRVFVGGWLRTGDIIEIRDGHLYFRGVRKRMIKYKGYPIFPRDLEALLEKHPAVEKAEVYGEPAGELGQVPVARVWLKSGAKVDAKELLEWVNRRVAPYKRIRRIEIVG